MVSVLLPFTSGVTAPTLAGARQMNSVTHLLGLRIHHLGSTG